MSEDPQSYLKRAILIDIASGSQPLLTGSKMTAYWTGRLNASWTTVFVQDHNHDIAPIEKRIYDDFWHNSFQSQVLSLPRSNVTDGTGMGVSNEPGIIYANGATTLYTQDPTGLLSWAQSGLQWADTTTWKSGPDSTLNYATSLGSDVGALRVKDCGGDGDGDCDMILFLNPARQLNIISGKRAVPIASQYLGDAFASPRFCACIDAQDNATIYVYHALNGSAVEEIQWHVPSSTWARNATILFDVGL